jgi:hypothetical protein
MYAPTAARVWHELMCSLPASYQVRKSYDYPLTLSIERRGKTVMVLWYSTLLDIWYINVGDIIGVGVGLNHGFEAQCIAIALKALPDGPLPVPTR